MAVVGPIDAGFGVAADGDDVAQDGAGGAEDNVAVDDVPVDAVAAGGAAEGAFAGHIVAAVDTAGLEGDFVAFAAVGFLEIEEDVGTVHQARLVAAQDDVGVAAVFLDDAEE